jgi:hypothetical protein
MGKNPTLPVALTASFRRSMAGITTNSAEAHLGYLKKKR